MLEINVVIGTVYCELKISIEKKKFSQSSGSGHPKCDHRVSHPKKPSQIYILGKNLLHAISDWP